MLFITRSDKPSSSDVPKLHISRIAHQVMKTGKIDFLPLPNSSTRSKDCRSHWCNIRASLIENKLCYPQLWQCIRAAPGYNRLWRNFATNLLSPDWLQPLLYWVHRSTTSHLCILVNMPETTPTLAVHTKQFHITYTLCRIWIPSFAGTNDPIWTIYWIRPTVFK